MTVLVWDQVGDKTFESGLEKGVLYLQDGSVIPWNGLTSVNEKNERESTQVYFDGMMINSYVSPGDFSATMKAYTYPDEFVALEGHGDAGQGVYLGNQPPKSFALSYRTIVGNDVAGVNAGYKLHILYNVTAVPSDKEYQTNSENPEAIEFEWDIFAVPEDIPGFRPSAHVIINSLTIDPDLLTDLEGMLYGTDTASPFLIPMSYLLGYIADF